MAAGVGRILMLKAGLMLYIVMLMAAGTQVPTGAEVIQLTPKFGTVTFRHQAHSQLAGVQCATCHHSLGGAAEPIWACHVCHAATHFQEAAIIPEAHQHVDAPATPPKAKEVFHTLCRGCHHVLEQDDKRCGPTDCCRDCHV